MNGLTISPGVLLAVVGGLLALLLVWRSGARRARRAADAARSGARLVSLGGRVVLNAGLITAAQWAVTTFSHSWWLHLAVLGLPALVSAVTITKSLTVTTVEPSKRGGRR